MTHCSPSLESHLLSIHVIFRGWEGSLCVPLPLPLPLSRGYLRVDNEVGYGGLKRWMRGQVQVEID